MDNYIKQCAIQHKLKDSIMNQENKRIKLINTIIDSEKNDTLKTTKEFKEPIKQLGDEINDLIEQYYKQSQIVRKLTLEKYYLDKCR